jgi:hypothetical protein
MDVAGEVAQDCKGDVDKDIGTAAVNEVDTDRRDYQHVSNVSLRNIIRWWTYERW